MTSYRKIRFPKTGISPATKVTTIKVFRALWRQVDTQERQQEDQIEGGQQRVQSGDPHLGEHDAPKCFAEPGRTVRKRFRQRSVTRRRVCLSQRDERPDDHPDHDVNGDLGCSLPNHPDRRQVLLQPRHDAVLQRVGIGRNPVRGPRGDQAAPALNDFRDFFSRAT